MPSLQFWLSNNGKLVIFNEERNRTFLMSPESTLVLLKFLEDHKEEIYKNAGADLPSSPEFHGDC